MEWKPFLTSTQFPYSHSKPDDASTSHKLVRSMTLNMNDLEQLETTFMQTHDSRFRVHCNRTLPDFGRLGFNFHIVDRQLKSYVEVGSFVGNEEKRCNKPETCRSTKILLQNVVLFQKPILKFSPRKLTIFPISDIPQPMPVFSKSLIHLHFRLTK